MHAVSARTPDPSGVKSLRMTHRREGWGLRYQISGGINQTGGSLRNRDRSIRILWYVDWHLCGLSFREGVFPAFGWLNVPAL